MVLIKPNEALGREESILVPKYFLPFVLRFRHQISADRPQMSLEPRPVTLIAIRSLALCLHINISSDDEERDLLMGATVCVHDDVEKYIVYHICVFVFVYFLSSARVQSFFIKLKKSFRLNIKVADKERRTLLFHFICTATLFTAEFLLRCCNVSGRR